jgi:hypothetical protein
VVNSVARIFTVSWELFRVTWQSGQEIKIPLGGRLRIIGRAHFLRRRGRLSVGFVTALRCALPYAALVLVRFDNFRQSLERVVCGGGWVSADERVIRLFREDLLRGCGIRTSRHLAGWSLQYLASFCRETHKIRSGRPAGRPLLEKQKSKQLRVIRSQIIDNTSLPSHL